MAPINVGLIGYGFATKCFHLPFILPNPDLKVYAFLQRAEAPANKEGAEGKHCTVDYPDAKHYRTADDFFADANIDLVVVCTQHDTHAEFAERALVAGKHVVVEKPFTDTSDKADRLLEIAKKSGKVLTVYQNRRYDSDFRTLHQLFQTPAFGDITECEIHFDVNFPAWVTGIGDKEYSPGDGLMFGLGSHTLDQALVLFGRPASVTGFYRALRGAQSNTDDSFIIILQYGGEKQNLLVTIKTSIVTPMPYPLKYIVRGYNGSFVKYGVDPQEPQFMGGMTPASPEFGVEPKECDGLLTTKEKVHDSQVLDKNCNMWVGKVPTLKGDYRLYYEDVVKAVKGEAEVAVKPETARDGIVILELARKSADEGRTIPFGG